MLQGHQVAALVLQLACLAASCCAGQTQPTGGRLTGSTTEVVTIPGFAAQSLQLGLPQQPGAVKLQLEGWHHDECPLSSLP